MNAENLKERKNNAAMTDMIPRKNIQIVQLATQRITRRKDVGKALEPISSPKTLIGGHHSYRYVHQPSDPKNKQTTSILKNPKN